MPASLKNKVDPAAPLVQSRIKESDKTPFVARCGNLLVLVHDLEFFSSKIIIMRCRILQGKHFNDRGDYGPGDDVTIGPISNYWRKISIPPMKKQRRL